MKIIRKDGSRFDVFGKLFDEIDLKMVVDDYNAPITAGNWIDLVHYFLLNSGELIIAIIICSLLFWVLYRIYGF